MKLFILLAVLVGSAVANEWINKIEPAAYQGSPNFDPRDTAALIENLFKSVGVGNVGISGQNLGSSTKQQLTAEMFNQLVDVIIQGVEAGLNATAAGSPGGIAGGLGGLIGGGGGGKGGVDMGALMGLLQGGKDGGVDMNALSSLLGNAGGTDGSTEDKASTDDGNTDTESDASTDDQMADLMNLLNEVDESDGESDTKRAVTGTIQIDATEIFKKIIIVIKHAKEKGKKDIVPKLIAILTTPNAKGTTLLQSLFGALKNGQGMDILKQFLGALGGSGGEEIINQVLGMLGGSGGTSGTLSKIINTLGGSSNGLSKMISQVLGGLGGNSESTDGSGNILTSILGSLSGKGGEGGGLGQIGNVLTGLLGSLGGSGRKRRDNAIKETINRLVNQFKGFAERFEMVVKKNIVKAKFALVEFGQQLEDAIDEVLKLSPDILKNGSKKVNELLSEIAGRSQVAVDKAVTKLQEEVQRISNSDLAKKTKEFFVPRIHAVIETLKSLGASANNSAKDLSKKIKDALANAGENAGLTQEKLKELFKDKLENLKDIKNAIKQIVDENISTLDDPKQY